MANTHSLTHRPHKYFLVIYSASSALDADDVSTFLLDGQRGATGMQVPGRGVAGRRGVDRGARTVEDGDLVELPHASPDQEQDQHEQEVEQHLEQRAALLV